MGGFPSALWDLVELDVLDLREMDLDIVVTVVAHQLKWLCYFSLEGNKTLLLASVVALWRSAHFTWTQPPTHGVKLRMWCCKKLTLDGDQGKSTTHTGSTFVT